MTDHFPDGPVLRMVKCGRDFVVGDRMVHALRDVSLEFPAGQFAAVVGKSGSGKSTLLNLCCGLDRATSGEVRLLGQPLTSLSDAELTNLRLSHVGFVFQFFNLLPTLSARENVALPARLGGMPPRAADAKAAALLESLGLGDRLDHWPDHLSGGEQQRVAIARALVNDPKLILADEPTGNLDTEAGEMVLAELRRLAAEQDRLVIMVTHSTEALDFADRVIMLKDGALVRDERLRGPVLAAATP